VGQYCRRATHILPLRQKSAPSAKAPYQKRHLDCSSVSCPLKRASLSIKPALQFNIACERVIESEAAQASHRSSPSVVLSVRDKFVLHRLGQARASFEESIVIQAALTRRLATNTTLQHPLWTIKQTLSELIQHPNNFDQDHQVVSETLTSSCLPKTEAKALLQQCRPGST
jgi:hypothetical protein